MAKQEVPLPKETMPEKINYQSSTYIQKPSFKLPINDFTQSLNNNSKNSMHNRGVSQLVNYNQYDNNPPTSNGHTNAGMSQSVKPSTTYNLKQQMHISDKSYKAKPTVSASPLSPQRIRPQNQVERNANNNRDYKNEQPHSSFVLAKYGNGMNGIYSHKN